MKAGARGGCARRRHTALKGHSPLVKSYVSSRAGEECYFRCFAGINELTEFFLILLLFLESQILGGFGGGACGVSDDLGRAAYAILVGTPDIAFVAAP
jgi:hypothetical protein